MKILAIGDFHGTFPDKLLKRVKKTINEEDVDLIVALGDYTGLPEWRPIVMKQLRAAKAGKDVPDFEKIAGKKKYESLVKRDFKAGIKVLRTLNGLGKPVLIIFGNGDWYRFFGNKTGKDYEGYVRKMRNLKNITYGKAKFKQLAFVGFGGYMDIDSFFIKKEWKQDEGMEERIERRINSKKILFSNLRKAKGEKILVLHYTPRNAFDIIHNKGNPLDGKSAGVSIFNEAMKKFNPKIVFCGHMHEYQGAKKLGKSLVINPGDAERGRFAVVDSESLKVKFYQ
jgi:Icc-related predicted phosphoesterase